MFTSLFHLITFKLNSPEQGLLHKILVLMSGSCSFQFTLVQMRCSDKICDMNALFLIDVKSLTITKTTSYYNNGNKLATVCIDAGHGLFSCIRQVAPVFTQCNNGSLVTHESARHQMATQSFCWAHVSDQQGDRLSDRPRYVDLQTTLIATSRI